MSTSAASHLSPPSRCVPRGAPPAPCAPGSRRPSTRTCRPGRAARLPRRRHAGRRQDDLRAAGRQRAARARALVEAVTVVAPTEHLKHQWADAASRVGIAPRPELPQRPGRRRQRLHRRGRDLRAGRRAPAAAPAPDRGPARRSSSSTRCTTAATRCRGATRVREAFEPATRRLALTGTPFRSDTSADPVRHLRGGTATASAARRADYSYGYGRALADGVVRPVIFLAYSGQMRWRTRAGDEISRDARRAADQGPDRARPGGPRSTRRATGSRRCSRPPTGGSPRCAAACPTPAAWSSPPTTSRPAPTPRSCAAITGEAPTVVLSDEAGAQRTDRGVRRVGRPLDGRGADGLRGRRHPAAGRRRLRHLDVRPRCSSPRPSGRFVRARRRGETASVFLPSVPLLLEHAGEMEVERDHALDRPPPRRRGRPLRAGGRAAGRSQPEQHRDRAGRRAAVRGARGGGALRPGALRRRRVRHADGRRDRLRRRRRLPRPARAAGARPGGDAAARSARATQQVGRAAHAGRPATRTPAASGGDAPGRAGAAQGAQRPGRRLAPPHRPARTGPCTPSCARPAAGRRPRRPPPSSCRPGST